MMIQQERYYYLTMFLQHLAVEEGGLLIPVSSFQLVSLLLRPGFSMLTGQQKVSQQFPC